MPVGHPGKPPATCHPDRPHQALGLCGPCYQNKWNAENPGRAAARPSRRKPATCHPERYELAKGLCSTCYRRARRADPKHQERERSYGREWQRKKREADPVSHRQRVAARRYGLTISEYRAMLDASGGKCAACGTTSEATLHIDHCHETGQVRGLLCFNCNSALGHARDDIDRLTALIEYLRRVG